MSICYLWKILIVEVDGLNKPRRIRIYKLSAYDTFTEEERALNEAYKKAAIKERATLKKIRDDGFITKEELRQFLILLNPLAPHITSEEYEIVFGKNLIDDKWPEYDEKFLVEDVVNLTIQINGRLSKVIQVSRTISQDELLSEIEKQYPELYTKDKQIKKVVYVPSRIVNLIF